MIDFVGSPGLLEICWKYFILGLVQGLTEFLPISSTAHLKVIPMLFGWGDPGVALTAVLQLGSILAVIGYFRSDLFALIQGLVKGVRRGQWREPDARLGFAICVGTLPILLVGILIKLFWPGYETSSLRSIPSIAVVSILMAFLLAIAERMGSRQKTLQTVNGRDGFFVGLGQIFALMPGVSRSGITLTASLFDGWRRKDAARFSFLLGIPAISLAGLVELKDVLQGLTVVSALPIAIGIFSAAIFSWASIDWLLRYLQTHNTLIFVVYRMLFGVILLLWWFAVASK